MNEIWSSWKEKDEESVLIWWGKSNLLSVKKLLLKIEKDEDEKVREMFS